MRTAAPQRLSSARPRAFRNAGAPKAPRCVVVRADPDEDEFEKRLASLTKSKVPYGTSRKDGKEGASTSSGASTSKPKKQVSYDDETLWREFAPARADLYFNVAMAATLVWLPLTAASIGRCAFVKYRITDKRLTVKAEAPWRKEETDIGFHEVANCVGVSRGFGAYGDMVVTLTDGEKLEMRSVPDWKEVRQYVIERRNAIRGTNLSPEELLEGKKDKGFA